MPPQAAAFAANPAPDFLLLMRQIAPARSEELDQVIAAKNVSFEIDEEAVRIFFRANRYRETGNRSIEVGMRCLPRLWSTAYAYVQLYNSAIDASQAGVPAGAIVAEVEFAADPTLNAARGLLQWAIRTENQIKLDDRSGLTTAEFEEFPPGHLPVPFAPFAPGSIDDVAGQLTWSAMGFLLHHELAHIRKEHIPLDETRVRILKFFLDDPKDKKRKDHERELQHEYTRYILVEKEADTEAAAWVLEGEDLESLEFMKRILGLVIGLTWLTASDPYIGPSNHPAYPPGYDRLFQTVDKFVEDPEHPIWHVLGFILALHLQNAGKWTPKPDGYETARDIANWAADLMAQDSRFASNG